MEPTEGRLHLVTVEYADADGASWSGNASPASRLLEPTVLPDVAGSAPMPGEDLDALGSGQPDGRPYHRFWTPAIRRAALRIR
jgi:hypothetical protein